MNPVEKHDAIKWNGDWKKHGLNPAIS